MSIKYIYINLCNFWYIGVEFLHNWQQKTSSSPAGAFLVFNRELFSNLPAPSTSSEIGKKVRVRRYPACATCCWFSACHLALKLGSSKLPVSTCGFSENLLLSQFYLHFIVVKCLIMPRGGIPDRWVGWEEFFIHFNRGKLVKTVIKLFWNFQWKKMSHQ